jgi:hypothetical protein
MVTVVATQELEAGDALRRFKAEAAQDEPRRGKNYNGYIVYTLGSSHLCVVFFLVVVGTRVCVCVMFDTRQQLVIGS